MGEVSGGEMVNEAVMNGERVAVVMTFGRYPEAETVKVTAWWFTAMVEGRGDLGLGGGGGEKGGRSGVISCHCSQCCWCR